MSATFNSTLSLRCFAGLLRARAGVFAACIALVFAALTSSCHAKGETEWLEFSPGIAYTNFHVPSVPWSINVVRISRARQDLEIHSMHARNKAVGLGTLSSMVEMAKKNFGTPLVAVNGDYYNMRDRAFAGDPRGLQISNGEVLSSPVDGTTFWMGTDGKPNAASLVSGFKITLPNGKTNPFGVNESRALNPVLYTPAMGASTRTSTNGLEFILERSGEGPWLPLAIGTTYDAKVTEVRQGGNTLISPGQMVLSIPPNRRASVASIVEGSVLKISTATTPDLKGVITAISGGPVLVRNGKWQELPSPDAGAAGYQEKSKYERHPRTAMGWNDKFYFFVEVDGRQPGLSVGMTLKELGKYLIDLGCTDAMNLDGGGSAMLWANGQIQSSPSDRHEREIANSLIVVRKDKKAAEQRP
jgi:exopolysaccharide biosynthesis protein